MFNPAVLLLPQAALVIVGLLAYAVTRYRDRPTPAPARHRMTPAWAADPHRRDWAAIAVERMAAELNAPAEEVVEYDPLDPRVPLAEVERRMALLDVAGHDDHPMDDDTRELVAVQ